MVTALDLIRLKELKVADERSLLQKQKLDEAQRELKSAIDRAVQEELRQSELQQEKAERTVATTVRVNLIATGAALISALLIGVMLSGLIAGPISELQTAALAVSQGNFDQRVRTRARDEMELTPFRGHFIFWEGGVHDVETKKGVSAGVPATDGRAGPVGPQSGRAVAGV